MNSLRIWQILIGLVLGIAFGVIGAQWWQQVRLPWIAAANAESEHQEGTDELGQGGEAVTDEHGHASHGRAGEGGHEGHADGPIVLSEKAIRESGIKVVSAGGGELEQTLTLPGEVVLNADKVAHIVPRVSGIVRRVDKNLGDEVQAREVIAILESRELAEAKAAYLAAQQRLALADANLGSAAGLHAKKIMPDLEFLGIQKDEAEAEIELKAAAHKLHALGVSAQQDDRLGDADSLATYELRAPFTGTVVQKHCSLGEVLNGDADAFMLADLSTVWVKIAVYTQDVGRVRVGQAVQVRADGQDATADANICYVAPVADEATRTVYARVDLSNPQRQWRPGTFVTATVVLERTPGRVIIPLDALQRVKSDNVVFIADEDGFEPRVVKIGRTSGRQAEILTGLEPGENYVAQGAVILKAELGKRQAVHVH
jgi:cobalt-zinc-cadmium efflux system membrane fusion protein